MIRLVELFLALRYLRPTRSYVSVITLLSLLGVIFGVMVLIVVLSVMEGFEQRLRDKVIGFNAHLNITNFEVMFNQDFLQKKLSEIPEVKASSPFAVGPVLVDFAGQISTPFVKGIRPDEMEKVASMKPYLEQGEWLVGADAVMVGSQWAKKNGAMVGDRILIHSPRNLQHLLSPEQRKDASFYMPTEYRISGIFKTGMFDFDYNFFLLPLGEVQRLYSLGKGVHGIAVRVDDPGRADIIKQKVNDILPPPFQAMTWMDQNKPLFSAIQLERQVMTFLLFFVIIVAAFGICSTLITITVQRAREIGVMKALGAQDHQILAVFTLYGLIVGVVGTVLGVLSGLLVLEYRNEFRDFLSNVMGIPVFPPEVYHFNSIPAVIDVATIAGIALAAVILSTLAALLPAMMAARFDPVESLRNE